MFSRAAVCQIGSSSGSSSFSRDAVGLARGQAEVLHDLADAERAGLDVRLELRRGFLAEPRPDVAERDVGEHHEAVLVPAGANRRDLLLEPLAGRAAGVDHHLHVDRIHRGGDARDRVLGGQGRRMSVDVDDRKLRSRDRVLRHDQRRSRLVLADGGRGNFRIAPLRRTRPDLPRRLLRADQGGGQDEQRRGPAPERDHRDAGQEYRSEPISRILCALSPRLRALRRFGEVDISATIIPLGPPLLAGSSDLPGGGDGPSFPPRGMPPYLVLLRVGFCLPPVLPRARCALTAPFHPYPPSPSALRASCFGGQALSRACPP